MCAMKIHKNSTGSDPRHPQVHTSGKINSGASNSVEISTCETIYNRPDIGEKYIIVFNNSWELSDNK